MFKVVGHEIEYDGKAFAVIIKPEWTSGFVGEAIDAIENLVDGDCYVSVDEVVEAAAELTVNINRKFIMAGEQLVKDTGLPTQYHQPLISAVSAIATQVAAEIIKQLGIEVEANADEQPTPGV